MATLVPGSVGRLALLVALRLWTPYWKTRAVQLRVRSDSVAGLTALGRLKSSGPMLQYLAREFSFDLGRALYCPTAVSHTPGHANCDADQLSRRWESCPAAPVPAHLAHCHVVPAGRSKAYFVQKRRVKR